MMLTEEQRRELRQVARQAVGRVSERAHFVLLSDQGKSVPEAAALMGYSAETAYTWLERYRQGGIAGLYDKPRSGRPVRERFLIGIVQAQASQSPRCLGYLAGFWTVALLAQHLYRRFKVKVGDSTLRRALARAGLVWGRPKLVLPQRRDPQAEVKLARLEEVLSQADATVVAEDECEVHLLPLLRAMWHRRGKQPRVPTPGQNQKRAVFGAVNLRTGGWHDQLTERKRSVEFIAFLSSLLLAYPLGPIYVLVDNASIHVSQAVQNWLAAHPRLELVYLPTYMGHLLNPVEKVWWALKRTLVANWCYKTLADLDRAISRYFGSVTREDTLRLINSPVVRQAQAALAANSSEFLWQLTLTLLDCTSVLF
jgi:transposase